MHEKLLRLCFFAERCVILEVNKIRQPPGCSKGVNEIMKEYAFGIDLGGTTAKIGLFTTAGALLEKWEVPTDTSNAGEHILENLAAAIMGKMQEKAIPAEQVEGVGIGVPGPVLDSSVVPVICANLGGWGQRNVSAQLSGLLDGIKVLVGNDANVAALGEIWMGAAKGCRSAVMVTLGTGVGGGIIIGGKIYDGMRGAGAELGHTLLVLDGEPCTCGRRGCWEAYSSATALIRQARQAAAEHPESLLAGAEEITGKTVFDAADRGDETANAVVDRFCDYLGAGVTNIVNALAPEVILIGGGISRQGERLLAPVRRYVEKNCFGGKDGAIPIIAAARLGNDAGIIGAAAL